MMLGIYGDSYADTNPENLINLELDRAPWAMILSNLIGKEMKSHAVSATSIWWSYKKFLKTYKNYDTIVFCYSNYDRWANINSVPYEEDDPDIFVNQLYHIISKDQLSIVNSEAIHIAEKLVDAHPYLYSKQLNIFLYQSIFNDINRICKEAGIQLVNLLPFEDFRKKMEISMDMASGPCLTNLMNITHLEIFAPTLKIRDDEKIRDDRLKVFRTEPDLRFCHINPYNNKILATIIKESLDNNIKYLNLVKDPRFSTDIKHLEYLL